MHVKRGFRWGFEAGASLLVNVDSDLLLAEDYFTQMHHAMLELASNTNYFGCPRILTGYHSATADVAYGANYLIDRDTYQSFFRPGLLPCRGDWDRVDHHGNMPWDTFLVDDYQNSEGGPKEGCPDIWRPEHSLAFHIFSKEALHADQPERAVGFVMDDFNRKLQAKVSAGGSAAKRD